MVRPAGKGAAAIPENNLQDADEHVQAGQCYMKAKNAASEYDDECGRTTLEPVAARYGMAPSVRALLLAHLCLLDRVRLGNLDGVRGRLSSSHLLEHGAGVRESLAGVPKVLVPREHCAREDK